MVNKQLISSSLVNSLKLFNSNILLVFFYSTLGSMIYGQQYDENISFELQNVFKFKNIFYLQSLLTIKNASISEIKYPEYYIKNELYLAEIHNELFVLHVSIPSREPIIQNSSYYKDITKWLNNFVILID